MKRWSYIAIPVILLFALIGWRVRAKQIELAKQDEVRESRKKAPATVSAAPAQVRDLVQTFTGVGSIESPFNVRIAPKVTGRIEYLQLREGDRVTVGQVL